MSMIAPPLSLPLAPSLGDASPGPYVSGFRRDMARGRWVALLLLVVWALSCFWALRSAEIATRVIGRDAAPSIAAAERIRSLLSDADRNLAGMTLVSDPETGAFSFAYRGDIADAESLMVDAAQNITYGDAEKTPIITILRGVAEYERLVGQARAAGSAAKAGTADALVRSSVLPATQALEQANYEPLAAQYEIFMASKLWLVVLVALTSLASLGVLLWLQLEMRRRARRLINPGLAAATIVLVGFSGFADYTFLSAGAELRSAKADAFDSVHALTALLAVANEAGAADGFWLVNYQDASLRSKYDDLYQSLTKQVVAVDPQMAIADVAGNVGFGGLLGDEFANITFVGEDFAAQAALAAWADYVRIEKQMRQLQADGHAKEAADLAGGDKPGQLNWAFTVFQRTIELTIKLNQNEFDSAIASLEARINGTVYGVLFAAWALASVTAWLGVRVRLREYEY